MAGSEFEWLEHAACVGSDVNTFYPERGDGEAIARAKAICSICPVVQPCLEDVLAGPALDPAVRGGMTLNERRSIRGPWNRGEYDTSVAAERIAWRVDDLKELLGELEETG